ncbi:MAG: hypothetical protein ACYC64_19310 [Armatimonadota bacterium]
MLLSRDKGRHFFYLQHRLLAYANRRLGLVSDFAEPNDIHKLLASDIVIIRNGLCDNPQLIDDCIRENPFGLTLEDMNIVADWKHFVRATFYVVKQLKNYAVFLSDEKPARVYGVVAPDSIFEEQTGRSLPAMIGTVLIPFDGLIVHDSLLSIYHFSFGSGIRKTIKAECDKAQSRFGIITSLPFTGEEQEQSDVDLLKFYMKNEDNRSCYWDQIRDLIRKNNNLQRVYHLEMGRIDARTYRKRFRESGLLPAWFAIFDRCVIAGGLTESEARESAQRIVTGDKHDRIFVFQFKE